jgi:NTE family protein
MVRSGLREGAARHKRGSCGNPWDEKGEAMRALVLGGGGAKGSFQAGVIEQLSGETFDFVVGTSAGALNAVGYSHIGSVGLKKLWMSIKSRSDLFSFSFLRGGLFSSAPLRKMIVSAIRGKHAEIPCWVSAVRLEDGLLVYARDGDPHFVDMTVASCCIPGVIEPYKTAAATYVDGGVRDNCPIKRAMELGATDITVILCSPISGQGTEWSLKKGDLFPIQHYAARAMDIIMNEAVVNDIDSCKPEILRIFAPIDNVCDTMDFDEKSIKYAYELGLSAKGTIMACGTKKPTKKTPGKKGK